MKDVWTNHGMSQTEVYEVQEDSFKDMKEFIFFSKRCTAGTENTTVERLRILPPGFASSQYAPKSSPVNHVTSAVSVYSKGRISNR